MTSISQRGGSTDRSIDRAATITPWNDASARCTIRTPFRHPRISRPRPPDRRHSCSRCCPPLQQNPQANETLLNQGSFVSMPFGSFLLRYLSICESDSRRSYLAMPVEKNRGIESRTLVMGLVT